MPLSKSDIEKILPEVKNEVGFNPDEEDKDVDRRLTRYIKRGAAYLEKIAGDKINFNTDYNACGLLIDYCRYANSQLTELFEKNFQAALASLNAEYQVKNFIYGGEDDD